MSSVLPLTHSGDDVTVPVWFIVIRFFSMFSAVPAGKECLSEFMR